MLERLGVGGKAMLDEAGMAAALRDTPLARVPAQLEHTFWDIAARATSDPAIGLRVGVERALDGRYSLLEYLAVHSPTLGDALEVVQRAVPLVDDRGRVDVTAQGELARVSIHRGGLPRARGYIDSLMATFVTTHAVRVRGFRLREAAFTQARPRVVRPYERLFGLQPRFDAPCNEIAFDRGLLQAPISGADPGLRELLWEHAQHLLSALPTDDPLLDAARRAVARGLAEGDVRPERVARGLGMSARTMRRRLAELGTSHQQLLDDLRRTLAAAELRHGEATLDALAERLGFASRSAFQRAFRRYTGMSPSAYRARFGPGAARGGSA